MAAPQSLHDELEEPVEVQTTLRSPSNFSARNMRIYVLADHGITASGVDVQAHVHRLLVAKDKIEELAIDGVYFNRESASVLADAIPKLFRLRVCAFLLQISRIDLSPEFKFRVIL